MSGSYRLIVTDTSPLFTLVLADSLDVLLRPGLSVSIPDAVYIEATRVRGAPGADRIVEWINDHLDMVRIIPTDIGIDQQRRLEEGRSIRGLGEQAAIEALERFLRSDAEARALLLFEDTDIERRRAVVGERVDLISTGDFLRELESARLIQSSDTILDRAAAQGRNAATSSGSARRSAILKPANGFKTIFGAIRGLAGEPPLLPSALKNFANASAPLTDPAPRNQPDKSDWRLMPAGLIRQHHFTGGNEPVYSGEGSRLSPGQSLQRFHPLRGKRP